MTPVVSIILTVYNRTQYLRKAIQSVLEQTYTSYEIIVADDSNNSDIKEICNSFNRPELIYKGNPTNLGVAINVRNSISEARGRYIAILNDDDIWEPQFLELLVNPLEQDPNRVLSFCNHWVIYEDGVIDLIHTDVSTAEFGRENLPEGEVRKLDDFVLKKNGVPLAMAAVFRKDGINLDLMFNEIVGSYDYWISCMLAATKRPAYFIPEKLTQYRLHGEMETRRKAPDKRIHLIFIYQKLLELNLFPEKTKYLRSKHGEMHRHVGKDYLAFNKVKTARKYFMDSLKISPSYKTMIGLLITFLPARLRHVVVKAA
jgi:glycosyltransferase involved in cell wall biosynthesis